jgi:hypothetical protein
VTCSLSDEGRRINGGRNPEDELEEDDDDDVLDRERPLVRGLNLDIYDDVCISRTSSSSSSP